MYVFIVYSYIEQTYIELKNRIQKLDEGVIWGGRVAFRLFLPFEPNMHHFFTFECPLSFSFICLKVLLVDKGGIPFSPSKNIENRHIKFSAKK